MEHSVEHSTLHCTARDSWWDSAGEDRKHGWAGDNRKRYQSGQKFLLMWYSRDM